MAWYLTDYQGTVQDVGSNAGVVLDQRTYDAFGNITGETDPAQGDRYGFQGMQLDGVIQEYGTWGRNFIPPTGRWSTEDPEALKPGPNPFEFVSNDPTNMTDPSGLWQIWEPGRTFSFETDPSAENSLRIKAGSGAVSAQTSQSTPAATSGFGCP